MPELTVNGVSVHYRDSGSGEHTIVFSHGLLMSQDMFEEQVRALSPHFRCISYDHRGQGRSEVTAGGYDMDTLTEDAAALIRALDAGPCHFVGLSMGGFVGMRLALRHPQLLQSLTLMESSADPEPAQSRREYRIMVWIARLLGFRPLIRSVMPIMFGPTFLNDPSRQDDVDQWRGNILSNNRRGTVRATVGVLEREGVIDQLGRLQIPTLVLVGDEDVATPLMRAQRMADAIPGARLEVINGAGHSASVEQPEAVTHCLQRFLASLSQPSSSSQRA